MTAPGLAQPIALSLQPASARRQIDELLSVMSLRVDTDGVVLALHEALVNAQRHGGGAVRAEAVVDQSALVLQVWDRGAGFDLRPFTSRPPDPTAERGRGLWLISRVASACEVRQEDGTASLVMRFEQR